MNTHGLAWYRSIDTPWQWNGRPQREWGYWRKANILSHNHEVMGAWETVEIPHLPREASYPQQLKRVFTSPDWLTCLPHRTGPLPAANLCMSYPSLETSFLLLNGWMSVPLWPSSDVSTLTCFSLLLQSIGCCFVQVPSALLAGTNRHTSSKTFGRRLGRGARAWTAHGMMAGITTRWRNWAITVSWDTLWPTWFFFVSIFYLDEKFVTSKLS